MSMKDESIYRYKSKQCIFINIIITMFIETEKKNN
jgi:hypothetical protein